MDWSWIDTVSTAAVGGLGIFFTWLTAKQGRAHALALSDHQAAHALDAARLSRDQDRKSEAYVHALAVAEKIGNWCQSVAPVVVRGKPEPLPDLPDLDSQVGARARLLAFGSPDVQQLWDAWEAAAKQVFADAAYLVAMKQEDRSEEREHRGQVQRELTLEIKPVEMKARKALSDRVNAELVG